jgi:arabinose-5-phosphate isomerase
MNTLDIAKKVISIEVAALNQLSNNLTHDFSLAVDSILSTTGRVIICGMGKSGIIGKKIAASFASTGTPSFFMHPGEAFHGDLGMVTSNDVFIAISNSGETDEVLKLLPFLKNNGNCIIAITGNKLSTLSKNSNFHLNIHVEQEACPLQLAPTSSTTATLVMGDALTVALMELRNFKPENFARFHPGGNLGKLLLSKVEDEMRTDNLPFLNSGDSFSAVVGTVSGGRAGLGIVVDGNILKGIITDGDIRRAIEEHGKEIFDAKANEIMQTSSITIDKNEKYQVALDTMNKNKVTSLIVVEGDSVIGLLKKE